MRLIRFKAEGSENYTCGFIQDDQAIPFDGALSMLDLIEMGVEAVVELAEKTKNGGVSGYDLDSVSLGTPLPSPPSLRDFSAFEQHILGLRGEGNVPDIYYQVPMFYFSNPHAIQSADEDVQVPPTSKRLDFELEVAAIMGKSVKNTTPEEGREAIFGFALLNDWSARDIQRFEMQGSFGFPKGKDSATSLGPWIVTADEFENRRDGEQFDIEMSVSLNGKQFGKDNLSTMYWTFGDMISYASRGAWVKPGDVIGSGTCAMGSLAEYWGRNGADSIPALAPGDVVEISADLLGSQRTKIVEGDEIIPLKSGH